MAIDFDGQGGFLQVRIDDDELQRLIMTTLSPAAMKRVQRRAVNETTAWIKSRLLRELPAATGLPKKILSERLRVKKASGVYGAIQGLVWIGLNPIAAIKLKDEGPIGRGYMSGGFYFEGGFKAKMRSGHVGIFARKGRPRLPIKEQNVRIDTVGNQIVRRLIPQAERALAQKTNRLIAYELERAA